MIPKDARPKLRGSLKVTQLDPSSYEILDPTTNARLELDAAGCLVAEQFESGEVTLQEARTTLVEHHALNVSIDQILEFLRKADALGFFEVPLKDLGIDLAESQASRERYAPSTAIAGEEDMARLESELSAPWYRRWLTYRTLKKVAPLVIVAIFPWKLHVTGPLVVEPLEQVIVRAPSTGIAESIYVREGDRVEPNRPLIKLEGFDFEIARKKSELSRAQAELEKLKAGSTREEITQARKKLELAQQLATHSETSAKRLSDLKDRGLVSVQDWLNASNEAAIKRKAVEEAEVELKIVTQGTRRETIRAKEAERAALLVDLDSLLSKQKKITVYAPMAGVVATPDTQLLVGKQFSAGEQILNIVNPAKMSLRVQISERDIGLVSPSMEMEFKTNARSDRTFRATISRISPVAEVADHAKSGSEPRFRIYAEIENKELLLLPGMTGLGRIDCGWRTVGVLFLRHAILYLRVNYVI